MLKSDKDGDTKGALIGRKFLNITLVEQVLQILRRYFFYFPLHRCWEMTKLTLVYQSSDEYWKQGGYLGYSLWPIQLSLPPDSAVIFRSLIIFLLLRHTVYICSSCTLTQFSMILKSRRLSLRLAACVVCL